MFGLPTSLTVNGVDHPIRYQYEAVLDIIRAFNDPEVEDNEKVYICLFILYEDFAQIPKDDYAAAFKAAQEFMDNGMESERRSEVKMVDFEQDEKLLFPAVNRVAGREIRLEENIHWWTFLGWFMEIGDCTYSQVLNIRSKKSKHKKLESWEQEFYDANRKICDIQIRLTERDKEIERRLNAMLS